jgi:hypothetical protein
VNRLNISRSVLVDQDRGEFVFVGFPEDCTEVSAIADSNGWHVASSGMLLQGGPTPSTWIALAKWAATAIPFPQLLQQIQQSDVIGRVTSEV